MRITQPSFILGLLTLLLTVLPSTNAFCETGSEDADEEKVIVGDLQFSKESSGAEHVCFSLNRFCSPTIFPIPGEKPRIVVDIKPIIRWRGKTRFQVEGHQIQQIRTHFHKSREKLRIVIDLNPSLNFTVEPRYYEAECRYCVYVFAEE